ncbi:MAG: hypothetical protein U9P14_04075 [Gemmatimonadota bacterium]|nr:hypothetical protein [Gemmatimonadota bacterium]
MPSRYPRIDPSGAKIKSIAERSHKVRVDDFGRPGTGNSFLEGLPDQLKAADWMDFCRLLAGAFKAGRPVAVMMGAHVVKVGCSPYLIDWIERGYIAVVAGNGAVAIHDLEIAMWGQTSEDVEAGLKDGTFGMVRETPEFIARAAQRAASDDLGLGEAIGEDILKAEAPHARASILAACYRAEVPVTIHVALGTDTIHQHPAVDGTALGAASMTDFRIFSAAVARLSKQSVVLNLGSAVIMPEVFLKALTLSRNLGHACQGLVTADFSMIQQYRPMVNVVGRPTAAGGGKGYSFIGHHELMIPLLHRCVEECLQS